MMLSIAARMRWSALVFATLVSTTQAAGLADTFDPLETREQAPALELHDLDGNPVAVADLQGKVVLLNFWATWCPPCREEMPSLERLHQAVDGQDIAVIAANVGEERETVAEFAAMLDPAPTFPLLLGVEFEALRDWEVRGLPTSLVIAPDGSVVYKAEGGVAFDHPQIIGQLRELLSADSETSD
jgi:thiol-disulfide isomerase/thioredoxin